MASHAKWQDGWTLVANPVLQKQEPTLDQSQADPADLAVQAALGLAPANAATQDPADAAIQQALGSASAVPTEQKVLQGSIDFWHYAKAKHKLTDEGIKRGWLGDQIMGNGGEGYQDALKKTADEEEAAATIDAYRTQNDLDNNVILNFITEAGAGVESLIPFMGEMAKGGAVGLGGGAVAGGIATLATGGAAAPVAIPLALNGARLGAGSAIGRIMAGQSYLEMRGKGISHDHATAMAAVNGIGQGALAIAQFGNAAKATGESAKIALGHWTKLATQFAAQQLKAIPHVALGAAQNAAAATIDHMSQGIAAILDSHPEASPLSLGSAAEHFGKSFVESLAPLTGVIGLGKTVGFTASVTGRVIVLNAKRTTQQVKAGFKKAEGRISELEKEFEAEEAARQERDLIDELNKTFEEHAAEQQKAMQEFEAERQQAKQADKQHAKSAKESQQAAERAQSLKDAKAELEQAQAQLKANPADKDLAAKVRSLTSRVSGLSRESVGKETKVLAATAEVRRIIAAAKSKFVIENDETVRQEIGRVQKLLKDLVKNSELDDNMQKRLLGRILNVDSVNDLVKQGEKFIEDIKEREFLNEQKAALGEVEKAIAFDAIEDGKSKFAKSISEEYQQPTVEAFNTYKEMVQDEMHAGTKEYQGKALMALDAYHDAISNSKDSAPLETGARIAAQVIGLKNKTPQALADLAEHIESLKKEGIDAGERQRLKERYRAQAIEAAMLEELRAGREIPTDLKHAEPEVLAEIEKGIRGKHAGSYIFPNLFSWDGILRWLTLDSKDPSTFLALLDAHKPVQQVMTAVREQTDKYHEALEKHSPNGKLSGATGLIMRGVFPERIGEYANHPDFVSARSGRKADSKLSLSPNQAVKLHLQLEDRSLDTSRIYGNGYTIKGEVLEGTSTQELLEDYFSRPDRKAYLDLSKGLREFYDQNFSRVKKSIWDQYGVRPDQNKSYSGYAAHEKEGYASSEQIKENWNDHLSRIIRPSRAGMTIERQKTAKPLASRDAFMEVYQGISQFEHWNVWRSAHVAISETFENQNIRNVIEQKRGKGMLSAIDAYRRDLVWGPQIRVEGLGAIGATILRQTADVALLGRPGQFVKQLTGVTLALQDMDHATFGEGMADFFKNPEKNWARLSRREFFKNRFADVMSQKIGIQLQQDFENEKLATFKEYAGIGVKYGDKIASIVGAHIVYKAALKARKSEAEALLAAEKWVNRTQSAGTADSLSNTARNGYLKHFFFLGQQPIRQFEQILIDSLRAQENPTEENVGQAARTIYSAAAGGITFATAGAMLAQLNPLASEKEKEAAWKSTVFAGLDPVFGAGIVGAAARYGVTSAVNAVTHANLPAFGVDNPIERAVTTTADIVPDMAKMVQEPSLSSFLQVIEDYVKGPNVLPLPYNIPSGLPILEPVHQLKNAAKKLEGKN
jgi:hypothetical protein